MLEILHKNLVEAKILDRNKKLPVATNNTNAFTGAMLNVAEKLTDRMLSKDDDLRI